MSLQEYLYPQLIKRFDSKYNQEVELVRFMGDLRLDMGGLTQSGSIIEKIWDKAISRLIPQDAQIKTVLLLGLGGGSAIKVIKRHYPTAQITAVEIDPVVVQIATEYFPYLKKHKVKVILDDAVTYITDLNERFDLVIIDCYQGHKVPPRLNSKTFIKKILKHSPLILINRLFWGEFVIPALDFKSSLEKEFIITTTRTTSNLILLARSSLP